MCTAHFALEVFSKVEGMGCTALRPWGATGVAIVTNLG